MTKNIECIRTVPPLIRLFYVYLNTISTGWILSPSFFWHTFSSSRYDASKNLPFKFVYRPWIVVEQEEPTLLILYLSKSSM